MTRTPLAIFSFVLGPVRMEYDEPSLKWVFTHLQKYSTCGFLFTWPFCFHVWFFWKKQQQKADENGFLIWQPGSEQGIYARTPGWRYDKELGMKFTRGYCGLNWD